MFAGLDPTGELDKETVELMETPRCGVKDNVGPSDDAKRRKKRYALQGKAHFSHLHCLNHNVPIQRTRILIFKSIVHRIEMDERHHNVQNKQIPI